MSLAHPFGCPTGDGGQCALPQPPIKVANGRLRIVNDGSSLEPAPMANPQALQPIHGAGREALLRALDGTGTTGVPDGLLLSCTCGHMYVAAGDEDAG